MRLKLKHFAGYGFVEAEKTGEYLRAGRTIRTIRVIGNHERGLQSEYHEDYELFNWLVKHFLTGNEIERGVTYRDVICLQKNLGWLDEPGVLPGQRKEYCDYVFSINGLNV